MDKTSTLKLSITSDNTETFQSWRIALDGNNNGTSVAYSNMQLIDQFAAKFAGGSSDQVLVKTGGSNFSMVWKALPTSALNNDAGFVKNSECVLVGKQELTDDQVSQIWENLHLIDGEKEKF